MDNSFFILSKQKVKISRFHICTWDIENENSFIELGLEFKCIEEFNQDTVKEIEFKLVAPFMKKEDTVRCLACSLIEDTNSCKFVFNDNIKSFSPIRNDKRHGGVLQFETRGALTILPLSKNSIDDGGQVLSFKIKTIDLSRLNSNYTRFLIKTKSNTLSAMIKGIAYTNYIYDIKLNEKRNLPDRVHSIINDEYHLCVVESCFCFHVIPNTFTLSFVDQNKLRNIRELEVPAFKKYLSEIESMENGKYIIVFNKDGSQADSYSFFTIFTREIIGMKQIGIAIAANIVCSLLFASAALRTSYSYDNGISFFKQIPIEYWFAILVLLIALALLFFPFIKKIKKIIL
ncbi:MAG: hypothetical protein FWG57_05305 [Endomicrobia bacterium]|nr:hypothetical protein [Endomicrobiia bacterium]